MLRTHRPRRCAPALVLACLLGTIGWHTHVAVRRSRLEPDLIAAVQAQDHAEVERLLDYGVDPNCGDAPSRQAPTVWEVIRGLWRRRAPGLRGRTPLMLAAQNVDLVSVQSLLRHGADASVQDRADGRSALIGACADEDLGTGASIPHRPGRFEIVRALLRAGADPNALDSDGNTALMAAVQLPTPDCAAYLLDHGADPNVRRHDGMSALMWASYNDNEKVMLGLVRLLIQKHADVNARYGADTSVLSVVSRHGGDEAARLIREAGGTGYDFSRRRERTPYDP